MVSVALMLPWTVPSTLTTLEHVRLDLPVGSDGEHVVGQLDVAVNVALDGQVLLGTQLALDDHRLPNGCVALSHGLVPPLISYGSCRSSPIGRASR